MLGIGRKENRFYFDQKHQQKRSELLCVHFAKKTQVLACFSCWKKKSGELSHILVTVWPL